MTSPIPKIGFLIDMDGLLINSEDVADVVFNEVCVRNGGRFTQEIRKATIGTESWFWSKYILENASLSITPDDFRKQFYSEYRKRLDNEIALMPGAQDLLDWIEHRKYPKCLVTSAGAENTNQNLSLLGLEEFFEHRVTAEISPEGKPHPGPYLMGAQVIGPPPDNCIVFEDSEAGTISGHDAGCKVIAVPTKFVGTEALKSADFILDSLQQSISLLEELGY